MAKVILIASLSLMAILRAAGVTGTPAVLGGATRTLAGLAGWPPANETKALPLPGDWIFPPTASA